MKKLTRTLSGTTEQIFGIQSREKASLPSISSRNQFENCKKALNSLSESRDCSDLKTASCSGSTRAPGIPSVVPSFSNLPSRAQRHQRNTLDLGSLPRDVLEDPIFQASSSSTSGTLQRSSRGFPTSMGAEKPVADRRATKHGTRLLHPSTEICEVLTLPPFVCYLRRSKRAVHNIFWVNSPSPVFRNGSLKKTNATLATLQNWRRSFTTEVCSGSNHPSKAVRWIKAIQEIIQNDTQLSNQRLKSMVKKFLAQTTTACNFG